MYNQVRITAFSCFQRFDGCCLQKRRYEDETDTPDTVQRPQKVLRQSREHSAATTAASGDAQPTSNPSPLPAANFVYIPTPKFGSAEAAPPTVRRRSALAEQVFDRIAVAPDHRKNPEAANADRKAQLTSLATRNPDLFAAATGAAKIESQKLPPSLQLTLINLLKYVGAAELPVRACRIRLSVRCVD
jgi:hypothetical protein